MSVRTRPGPPNPKSEEHKAKIAANRKGGKPKGWRKDKSAGGGTVYTADLKSAGE